MPEYKDIKGGDLMVNAMFEGVFIGLPTPEHTAGGHSGVRQQRIPEGILTYLRIQGYGDFQATTQDDWDRGAHRDYHPRDSNPQLCETLLEYARTDIVQGTRRDLGLLGLMDPAEVIAAIDNILKPN